MLGPRIAALRRRAGWSQAELAARLQVSASAIGMYEQGRREPSGATLVSLSQVFGVSTDYLLTGRLLDSRDNQALSGLMQELLDQTDARGLSRRELAALFAAMLTEP